jgi:hypothetical protein
MKHSLHVHAGGLHEVGGKIRHIGRFDRHDDGQIVSSQELWYEFETLPPGVDPEDLAPFFMVLIQLAMEERRTLHVHGGISRSQLANLEEFCNAWQALRPAEFHGIPFVVDGVVDDAGQLPLPGAVATASGGLDSAFTLWRHAKDLAGYATLPIRQVVMMDGIELDGRPDDFRRAVGHNRAMVESLGLNLTVVKTNYRQALPHGMLLGYGSLLASCLYHFKGRAGNGLIASGHPYAAPEMIEYGSNALTDPLLSCNRFRIHHDGASYRRLDKMIAVAAWPEYASHVRVCWQDDSNGLNCGHCEKCLRTALIQRVLTGVHPPAFPPDVPLRTLIEAVRVPRERKLYWAEFAAWIRETGRGTDWLALAEQKGRIREPFGRQLRRLFQTLAGK